MSSPYPPEKHPDGPNPHSQHEEEHHDALPPPYTGPASSSSSSLPAPPNPSPTTTPLAYPGLPKLNYAHYVPPDCKLSSDKTTITCTNALYGNSPAALLQLIQDQASIPPRVIARVQGTSDGAVDFDIRLNLMPLLVPQDENGGVREKWTYVQTIPEGEMGWRGGLKESSVPMVGGGLEEWVRRYCRDEGVRQFQITRTLTNLDIDYLEGRFHALIASTGYRGHVAVTFPTSYSKFLLKSSTRSKSLLSSVTSLFASPKRYEVVTVVWPFASVRPGADGRRFATVSEEMWWSVWKDAVRYAVVSKRRGWVTVEDQLEFLMNPAAARVGGLVAGLGQGVQREWGRDLM